MQSECSMAAGAARAGCREGWRSAYHQTSFERRPTSVGILPVYALVRVFLWAARGYRAGATFGVNARTLRIVC